MEVKVDEAEKFKEAGNVLFKDKKFAAAIIEYSKAIDANPNVAAYYANRAFCNIKLENYGSAATDGTMAIEVDPSYPKGYYRRGCALVAQGKYKEAQKDLRKVAKMCPSDRDARVRLKACTQAVREQAFADAIQSENTAPASETVDVDSMVVEDSYDGPRMGDKITVEFVQELIAHLKDQKKLHKKYLYRIVMEIIDLLKELPTLVDVDVPEGGRFTVCGDVHGQYYDFLNILELNGMPSETNPYLFNGDFVDRGSFSMEVIVTMFALKLLYPNHFHMTRGNHESRVMNLMYGFQGEVKAKGDDKLFELFNEAFCWLPLSYVINKKVFVVHGGLFSEDGVTLDDIRAIDRNRQPPDHGLMCEILWSDPQKMSGRAPSKRGCGLSFGPDVTEKFCKTNGLSMVVRSHEVKENGYEIEPGNQLVTVFSAPNYCDQMGNKGAYIVFDSDMNPTYNTFTAVPHPNVRPMAYAKQFGSQFGI